jgi:hypothetical protein
MTPAPPRVKTDRMAGCQAAGSPSGQTDSSGENVLVKWFPSTSDSTTAMHFCPFTCPRTASRSGPFSSSLESGAPKSPGPNRIQGSHARAAERTQIGTTP